MLFNKLFEYANGPAAPFHMPGHKRNALLLGDDLPYRIDITEIDGFDDLHKMRGVLKDTALLAAQLYGADSAFPTVNGSTGGIIAAIRAAALRSEAKTGNAGETIVISRASHKSVYNAVELCGLEPVYVAPQCNSDAGILGEARPLDVFEALEQAPNAVAVVITSPTYEGAISDIAAISELTRARNIPLIVDAAHGAHFGFGSFSQNAVRLGADIEIVSLHKTLPSLTQSALVLTRHDWAEHVATQLRIFETSSPSYVLLASIDRCLRLLESRGPQLFAQYESRLREFYDGTAQLKHLEIIGYNRKNSRDASEKPKYDPSKIVISTQNSDINGKKLAEVLREKYNIETEMAAPKYALAMTSICDTDEAFTRLTEALWAIDATLSCDDATDSASSPAIHIPKRIARPNVARHNNSEPVDLAEAFGRSAAESVWAYPPGIPIVVPGEIIDSAVVAQFKAFADAGIELYSDSGNLPNIMVLM